MIDKLDNMNTPYYMNFFNSPSYVNYKNSIKLLDTLRRLSMLDDWIYDTLTIHVYFKYTQTKITDSYDDLQTN